MTKDEAAQKITEAHGPPANGAALADNQAYAMRLATALDALGLLPQAQPASQQQNQSHEQGNPHQPTHHRTDPTGTVSTPHPMTESRHGVTPGGDPTGQSWRRQPTPDTPAGSSGAA